MNFFIENDLELVTDTEYPALYAWCLREFNKAGKQIGPDYIPWGWTLHFEFLDVQIVKRLTHSEGNVVITDEMGGNLKPLVSEKLRPVSYSLFGTNRTIDTLGIIIRKSKETACSAVLWGTLSSKYEFDLEIRTDPDFVGLEIDIPEKQYDELIDFLKKGTGPATVSLRCVPGFYSEWTPSIYTTHIKILASAKDQQLRITNGAELKPPELGKVGTEIGSLEINFKQDTSELRERAECGSEKSSIKPNPETDNYIEPTVAKPESETDKPRSDEMLKLISRMQTKVSRLSIPLWIAAIAMVIAALK